MQSAAQLSFIIYFVCLNYSENSVLLIPFMPLKGILANNVDPDQTSQKAVSDQDLHCLIQPIVYHK